MAVLPCITPARLSPLREPFDDAEWLFEVKHDGFRGLAYIEHGSACLVSRNFFAFDCLWLNGRDLRALRGNDSTNMRARRVASAKV